MFHSMDLHGLTKVVGEFSPMHLVNNVKKIVKGVFERLVALPGKYRRLREETILEYRGQPLPLITAKV